jgi:hypothetical protein
MSTQILDEIQTEVATLPLEKQIETLHFIKFIARQNESEKPLGSKAAFKSVRGALNNQLSNLENDLVIK